MGAVTVPVLVDTWQYECCGDEPRVGAVVSWGLEWRPEQADRIPTEWRVAARVEPLPTISELPPAGRTWGLARAGGLVVLVAVPAGTRETVLRGTLYESHHGPGPEEVPATRGRVGRVRMASWDYRLERREWHRVAGSLELEDVESASVAAPDRPGPDGTTRKVACALVDFEVG